MGICSCRLPLLALRLLPQGWYVFWEQRHPTVVVLGISLYLHVIIAYQYIRQTGTTLDYTWSFPLTFVLLVE